MDSIEITVLVDNQGKTTVSVSGQQGSACTNLTSGLLGRLGKVENQELTGEYYQRETRVHQTQKRT